MMRLLLIAPWLLALSGAAQANEARSQALFTNLCTACHGTQAEGRKDLEAPMIAGLPAWYIEAQLTKFKSGARGQHPLDIAGNRMRPMAATIKSDEDVKGLAALVSKLPMVQNAPSVKGGSAIRGEERFKICISCHGAEALGNQALNAPPLAQQNDWYLLAQLKNFKAGLRGGDPAKDPIGASMRAMSTTLDEQGQLDVVAYIKILAK